MQISLLQSKKLLPPMSENVASIFGGPKGVPEPNETCVKALEELLEMARSGEIVGVAMAGLCADHMSRYAIAGNVGGYGMLGAMEVAKSDLVRIINDD